MLTKANTQGHWTYWPSPVALDLLARTASGDSADTFAAAVSQPTCRETPVETQDLQAIAQFVGTERVTTWQVWDRDQSRYPKFGDVLREQDGTRWRVRRVRTILFDNVYICTCVKERS